MGEQLTVQRLSKEGFRVLDRNWRRPWGEIDIVAEKDRVIHFVEVKTNQALQQGFEPHLRANPEKMAKVVRTARTWLAAKHYPSDSAWQIDVASVIMEKVPPEITFFENI